MFGDVATLRASPEVIMSHRFHPDGLATATRLHLSSPLLSGSPEQGSVFHADRKAFKAAEARSRAPESPFDCSNVPERRSYWERHGVAMVQIVTHAAAELEDVRDELRADGHEVALATTLRGACEHRYCADSYPDIVLLDGGLPGAPDRVIQNAKVHFRNSRVLVLGRRDASGRVAGIDAAAAFRGGLGDFMWFPCVCDSDELMARVERLLTVQHCEAMKLRRDERAAEQEEWVARSLRLQQLQNLSIESAGDLPPERPPFDSGMGSRSTEDSRLSWRFSQLLPAGADAGASRPGSETLHTVNELLEEGTEGCGEEDMVA